MLLWLIRLGTRATKAKSTVAVTKATKSAGSEDPHAAAISEFTSVTGSSVKVATDLLKKHSWQVERAVDAWFNEARPAEPPKVGDSKKLQVVFNKFAGKTDKTKDLMQDEKLAEFFASIGIDAAGVGSLAVAHQLGCKTLGLIRRSEFQDGWATLGVDTEADLGTKAKEIAKQVGDSQLKDGRMRDFYRWLFDFVKADSKSVELSTAVEMWDMVLRRQFPLLDKWTKFLEERNIKAVSFDLWTMTYEFARDVGSDLSNYDPDGAWPGVVDEFVTSMQPKVSDSEESR